MAYLLCQPRSNNPADGKTIISCNSTTFSDIQKRYSPFECEALCAVWLCRSEDFFLRGADEIKVFTDAKGLKGLYEGELGKIANSRLQGMMEKLMPYNLNFFHVPGKENEVADFVSRYPRSELKGEEFPIFRPSVCHRSRRVQEKHFNIRDPEADRLAQVANDDMDYKRMVDHITNRTPTAEIEADCELKKVEESISDLCNCRIEEGNNLILKNGQEILIPQIERESMLDRLHATHLETEGMKRLCRRKFWWPKYGKDIEARYRGRVECKEDSN